MQSFENIHDGKTAMTKHVDRKPGLSARFENSAPRPFRRRWPEDHRGAPGVDHAVSSIVRVIENRERATFRAEFGFDLAGVIWNGRTRERVEGEHAAGGAKGDGLSAQFLPLLGPNSEVTFTYSGSAETNFCWSIRGAVCEASSQGDAIASITSLRHSLEMVLASEPGFNFAARQFPEVTEPNETELFSQMLVQPRCVTLEIPSQSTLGFGRAAAATALGQTVRMPLLRLEKTAFRSLAEAVVLNPTPTVLSVRFGGFALDDPSRKVVAAALNWLRRRPASFQNEGADPQLALGLSDTLQEQLQEWLQNPRGATVSCRIFSRERLPDCVLQMIGRDVFGVDVSAFTVPTGPDPSAKTTVAKGDDHPRVDLGSCLHVGMRWPSLFPAIHSIARARVQRMYNHEVPAFSDDGIVLGEVEEHSGHAVRFAEPDRSQHLYVLGATGTGKSTLLFNMILQDIRAGRGVGLIDPHGDLYDELLAAIPLSRAKDVVLFNPGNLECAAGINVLECDGPNRDMQVNFAINELLSTFARLYDMRSCGGPVFETYFRNAMLLLLESGLEDVTLTELSLVFEDSDYRKYLKGRCRNPLVVGFWTNQAEKVRGDNALENMAPYIASKVNAFTCNALVRPIVGQAKSTIDFRQILGHRGILLVKLPKGILGELNTQLLGSLLLSKVFATAMGRAGVKSTERSVYYLYVDEFQNFINDTVAHMMSEARKYGLCLTLANQTLSQLQANFGQQNVSDSVLGNVGNLIAFRVGPNDAEKLWTYTKPEFGGLDLQGLPNFHAVGRLLCADGPTRPFVFRTLLPCKPRGYRRAKVGTWTMRERLFARPIAEVEDEIIRRRTAHKENPRVVGRATTADILGNRTCS